MYSIKQSSLSPRALVMPVDLLNLKSTVDGLSCEKSVDIVTAFRLVF